MTSDREPPVEPIGLPFPEALALWLLTSEPADSVSEHDLRRLHTLSVAFVLLVFSVVALLAWFGAA